MKKKLYCRIVNSNGQVSCWRSSFAPTSQFKSLPSCNFRQPSMQTAKPLWPGKCAAFARSGCRVCMGLEDLQREGMQPVLFFGSPCFYSMTQPAAVVIRTNPGDFPSHTSHSHVSPLVICFPPIVSIFFTTYSNMFHCHKHKLHISSWAPFWLLT